MKSKLAQNISKASSGTQKKLRLFGKDAQNEKNQGFIKYHFKKRTKEKERVLLYVPNREIVISKLLFF